MRKTYILPEWIAFFFPEKSREISQSLLRFSRGNFCWFFCSLIILWKSSKAHSCPEWTSLEISLEVEKCSCLKYVFGFFLLKILLDFCFSLFFNCFFQVIKSARVMKKAVAHLIPFLEEIKRLNNTQTGTPKQFILFPSDFEFSAVFLRNSL